MIGVDIVVLKFATCNSRWREQRFLDKLFSLEEQEFICSDEKRLQNIWRLWSMKESAYKIISRTDAVMRFNPKAYGCYVTNEKQGRVEFENSFISTVTSSHQSFIHTTAFVDNHWTSEVFKLKSSEAKTQHKEAYQRAIKAFSNLKGVSENMIEIYKNQNGAPEFYSCGNLYTEQLSLTHHGNFGAFAIAFQ